MNHPLTEQIHRLFFFLCSLSVRSPQSDCAVPPLLLATCFSSSDRRRALDSKKLENHK